MAAELGTARFLAPSAELRLYRGGYPLLICRVRRIRKDWNLFKDVFHRNHIWTSAADDRLMGRFHAMTNIAPSQYHRSYGRMALFEIYFCHALSQKLTVEAERVFLCLSAAIRVLVDFCTVFQG